MTNKKKRNCLILGSTQSLTDRNTADNKSIGKNRAEQSINFLLSQLLERYSMMRRLLSTYILIVISQLCFGQIDSTKIFESSKGKWPLPIRKYLKIYDNEDLKRFTSNQFDSTLRIITDSSYQVKAVHDGTVTAVIEIEGEYTVLTNFGDYFISYSRLSNPNLIRGEFIKVGQQLGQIIKHWTEETYTLEITLSKGTKELSAERWFAW